MLTMAKLLHAEFSAMDYTVNIVSKCRFFSLSLNICGLRTGPGKLFIEGPGSPEKSCICACEAFEVVICNL